MGIRMAKPVLIGDTYYLRVSVPSDIAARVRNTRINIPVDGKQRRILVKQHVKTSLRTKDAKEAKRKHAIALAAVEEHWETVRQGPKPLSYKQMLELAGSIRSTFIDAADEEPGPERRWATIAATNIRAASGVLNPLAVPTADTKARDLETR